MYDDTNILDILHDEGLINGISPNEWIVKCIMYDEQCMSSDKVITVINWVKSHFDINADEIKKNAIEVDYSDEYQKLSMLLY